MKKNSLQESIRELSNASRARKAATLLASSAALLTGLANADLPSQSDIDAGDVNTVAGDAVYTVNATNDIASITASEHSVVEFYGVNPTGNSLTIGAGDVLNLISNGGAINLLLDDLGSNPTEVFGSVMGDNNVSLYIRNTDGVIFGDDASVTNVPSLVAMTHDFADPADQGPNDIAMPDHVKFINFSNGVSPLELIATGSSIQVRDLEFVGGDKLVFITDIVNITGDVVSSGEMHIAIGQTVELNLPGTGMLSVDITGALSSSSGALLTGPQSTIEADTINWNVALSDPASLAVNSRGVIRATGVSANSDGSINIVAKGGLAVLDGEMNANDGQGDVNLTGDRFLLRQNVIANQLNVNLGAEALTVAASDGYLDVGSSVTALEFVNPTIVIKGAEGFSQTVKGFVDYQVTGDNYSTASMLLPNGELVDGSNIVLENIGNLIAPEVEYNNNIFISFGGSIDSIETDNGDDTFIIEGMAGTLSGGTDDDIFIMNGGTVTNSIIGGSGTDEIRNVFFIDENGMPSDVFLGVPTSQNIANWEGIDKLTPASIPPTPIDIGFGGSPVPDNLLAGSNSFGNLGGLGAGSLQLAGDSALNAPCGVMGNMAESRTSASLVTAKEPCYDTPEYLALLNTTIYFNNDSSKILSPAAAKLDRVSDFVLESDMFREISVSGHTDSNAADGYNLALSKRRADAAVSYMANKGVEPRLFKTYSYGETLPAVPNDKAENLAKNRRVVVELKR